MKSFHIRASNAAGRWSYIGLYRSSCDAVIDALERGATRISVKPAKA